MKVDVWDDEKMSSKYYKVDIRFSQSFRNKYVHFYVYITWYEICDVSIEAVSNNNN